MIIFFCAGGCIFIVAFALFLLTGATAQICGDVSTYMRDNYTTILISAICMTLVISAIMGYVAKRFRVFFANCLLMTQILFGLLYGLYNVVTRHPDSFFLTLWCLIIYLAVFIVDAFFSILSVSYWSNQKKIWPMMCVGILGIVFQLSFW